MINSIYILWGSQFLTICDFHLESKEKKDNEQNKGNDKDKDNDNNDNDNDNLKMIYHL